VRIKVDVVYWGVDKVRSHKRAADPAFQTANAQDLLTDNAVVRLAPIRPCLLPHFGQNHVPLADSVAANAAVVTVRGVQWPRFMAMAPHGGT
jgi:hypothetical protein